MDVFTVIIIPLAIVIVASLYGIAKLSGPKIDYVSANVVISPGCEQPEMPNMGAGECSITVFEANDRAACPLCLPASMRNAPTGRNQEASAQSDREELTNPARWEHDPAYQRSIETREDGVSAAHRYTETALQNSRDFEWESYD